MPNLRSLGLLAVLVIASGCVGAGPTSIPSPDGTVAPNSTIAATSSQAPKVTVEPTPIVYAEVEKLAEGGHGALPPVDLPASFVVDYTATGTCEFTIRIAIALPDEGETVASLSMAVTGTTVSGIWPVNVQAGSYYVAPGEAVGCTFHLVAHAPTATTSPVPMAQATPVVYFDVTKVADGPHGFADPVALPPSFVVDYSATGTCEFSMNLAIPTPDVGASVATLAISVTGTTVSGSWPVKIPAGSYWVRPGEAVGCTFVVTVRDPS